MMRSLFSGVSGLKVHQTRMDVIGNNIANINTIGFKSGRTTFSDMLSQLQSSASAPTEGRGGVNAKQIGLGVNVESIDLIFTDSSPQQTGKNTDLALSGNGLFVLSDGSQSFYTRNGAFSFDESGYYVMPGNGLRVQGWNAVDGIINTNGTATDVIVEVGKTMEATATNSIKYSGNLNKESLMIDKISYVPATGDDVEVDKVITFDGTTPTSINVDGENVVAATLTLRDGTTMNVTSGYYEVGRSIPVTTLATIYDSLGGRHEVTVLIDKDPTSVDDGANEAAQSTATQTYYYTDENNVEHKLTANNDTVYQYTPDGAEEPTYVSESDVTFHTTVDGADQVLQKDSTGYYYTDAEGNRVDVAEGAVTFQTTVGGAAQDVTKSDASDVAYKYKYNGETYYVSEADAGNPVTTYDNRWRVYLAPGVGEQGPAGNFTNQIDSTESDGTTMTAIMNGGTTVSYLYFDDRGQFVTNGHDEDAQITFTYGNGNGAGENIGVIDFTGMTQYANSTTSFPITNGNAAGILQSIAVDGNGIISGTYTNGLVRQEAQIAVAQFSNSSGLTKVGTTIYQESNNSGLANVKTIADFGLSVVSSALEMSNVDLATEFSDMIVTQRGFQANSKVTTVSDEMLETLVNMKR